MIKVKTRKDGNISVEIDGTRCDLVEELAVLLSNMKTTDEDLALEAVRLARVLDVSGCMTTTEVDKKKEKK